jgi:hypothetical protein
VGEREESMSTNTSELAGIGHELETHVPEIIAGWKELTLEEPWIELPDRQRLDHLPAVIASLAAAALGPAPNESALRQVASDAAEHGRHRRMQGKKDDLLFREYYYLREAIWRHLKVRYGPTPHASTAILRIDTALALATTASLYGFHRGELGLAGQWPEVLEQFVKESPLRTTAGSK